MNWKNGQTVIDQLIRTRNLELGQAQESFVWIVQQDHLRTLRLCTSIPAEHFAETSHQHESSLMFEVAWTMLLSGIIPPITTPFYADGSLLQEARINVERFSRTPVSGIVVLGSTGEAIMLSDQERRDVLKVARETAAPNKVLVAGTGVESAIETLRLTEYAAELGYDVAMVRTPHYYKKQMPPANLLAFYRSVADHSPLPVIIYNFPQATGYDIPAEVVIELAEHPNLIGIKESSGDVEKVRKMVVATRHIKRSATVTETFEAVTPRMLAAAVASKPRKRGRGTDSGRSSDRERVRDRSRPPPR